MEGKKVAEKENKNLEACNVAKEQLLQAACEKIASRPYIEGRFVHLSELDAKLFCRLCKAVLSLMDVIRESRKGMHSILNMKCRASDVLNKIPMGKIHPRKSEKSVIPDINSKMALSNVYRSSSKKMLSNFVKITFSFLISSCFPPRAFLVMQRCQVLQLDSVE